MSNHRLSINNRFFEKPILNSPYEYPARLLRLFASQQIYTGDLFEQVDQARDFVLEKINRAVGTRANSITAPAIYELPPDAVGEAIVNAIAHRDYHSNASVEIRLFADRLEVWSPEQPLVISTNLSKKRIQPSWAKGPLPRTVKIANNAEIEVIWDNYQEKLEPLRDQFNKTLKQKWQEWEIPRDVDDNWSKEAGFPSSKPG